MDPRTRIAGSEEQVFAGVSIDSRSVCRGALFVAIQGERHDGHHFLTTATLAGAAGVLVAADLVCELALPEGGTAVAVSDTTRALGELAAGHRAPFGGPVVAITGSNGKTTTKEMCAAILGSEAPCLYNEGNLNNQYGLPLTLLRRESDHLTIVVELGMNHRGEIAQLAQIARPTVGVITNVGSAHIEFLGSRDTIAREKGDLVAALPEHGTAVLNRDDTRAFAQAERTRAHILSFGLGREADVRAEKIRFSDCGHFEFDLVCPSGRHPVRVAGIGEATVPNALAAAAAAHAAGSPLENIAAGLATYRGVRDASSDWKPAAAPLCSTTPTTPILNPWKSPCAA